MAAQREEMPAEAEKTSEKVWQIKCVLENKFVLLEWKILWHVFKFK